MPNTDPPADTERADDRADGPPDPFADLPPSGGQPRSRAPSEADGATGQRPAAPDGDPARREPSEAPPPVSAPKAAHESWRPSSDLVAAVRWTARFFQRERPDLLRVIGGGMLIALVSLVAGLRSTSWFLLPNLLYFPFMFVLTGMIIIAAYDNMVGQRRSDIVRLKWAIYRSPAVVLAGFVWAVLAGLGLALFVLPGIYIYIKGLLIGPAAILEDGLALRPFRRSKVATHRNNLTVVGLLLVTIVVGGLLGSSVDVLTAPVAGLLATERFTAPDVRDAFAVIVGLIVFPLLAPAYTWVYAHHRP